MSMSTPARNALRAAACSLIATPWGMSSPIEFQSLTSHPRSLRDNLRIPRRRQSQRNRKLCLEPMNDVEPEKDGNMQPRLLHRDVLVCVDLMGIDDVKQRSDLPVRDHVPVIASSSPWSSGLPRRILH